MIHSKNEARDGLKAVVLREIPSKSSCRSRLGYLRAKCSFSTTANSPGFTLIEVLLATALVGLVLGPIYILQSTVFNNVARTTDAVERMFIAYDFFLETQKKKAAGVEQKTFTKKITDPKTELVYEIKELSGNSVLAKQFNHLYIEKVSWTWSALGTPYDDMFINIVYEPPEKKSEEKSDEQKKTPEKPAQQSGVAVKQQPKPSGGKA